MKPIIGISPSPAETAMGHGLFRQYALSDTYTQAVVAAGGIPVILPLHVELVEDVLDELDGIIFSGGGDIDPAHWGEEPHPRTYGMTSERDEFELRAIREAVARDIPMLGICRGIQTINVALGGTIVQDIPDQWPNAIQHRQHDEGVMRDAVSHPVTIREDNNLLYRIHGDRTMQTNSFHHQAVKDVGEGLEVVATSADGVIEAAWIPAMTFGLGVQWHPEMLADRYPEHAAIFEALVSAAAEQKASRTSPVASGATTS